MKSVELEQLSLEELWNLFPITLVDNHEKYKVQYKKEEQYLKTILQPYIKRINHIGSTSISNIKTKPIVDILLEVETEDTIKKVREILVNHHYILMSEDLSSFRISLNKGYTSKGYASKVFHIHIRKYKDCDELYFRDYLNENLKIAKEYEKLKLDLYEKYNPNRDLYTKGKNDFVVKIVQMAKQKYKNRY